MLLISLSGMPISPGPYASHVNDVTNPATMTSLIPMPDLRIPKDE